MTVLRFNQMTWHENSLSAFWLWHCRLSSSTMPPSNPGGLLFDPDEAVLLLVTLLPLACVLTECWPNIQELPYYTRRCMSDLEMAGADYGGSSGPVAWLLGLWQRLLGIFGLGDASYTRHQELESALSAVVMQRRWGQARMQAQVALRQKDREQNAKALLTAVHTLRTVATAERGAHQHELAALETAALSASAEMQRERDERLHSQRAKAERALDQALASERRRHDARHKEQDVVYRKALEAAAVAHQLLSATEFAHLEAEIARAGSGQQSVGADTQAKLDRALAAAQQAERASGQIAKQSEAHLKAQAGLWEAERAGLHKRCEEAQLRAEHLGSEVERLRAQVEEARRSRGGRFGAGGDAGGLAAELQDARDQLDEAAARKAELMEPRAAAGAELLRRLSSSSDDGGGSGTWAELGAALANTSKRSVAEPPSAAARLSNAGTAPNALQLWQLCQQWRRVDAVEGFCPVGGKAASSAASLLGAELSKLERSIEEEVRAVRWVLSAARSWQALCYSHRPSRAIALHFPLGTFHASHTPPCALVRCPPSLHRCAHGTIASSTIATSSPPARTSSRMPPA